MNALFRWFMVIASCTVFMYSYPLDFHKEYTFWNATGRDIEIEIVRLLSKNVIASIPAYAPQMSIHPEGIACLSLGVPFRVRGKQEYWQDITSEYRKGSYANNCANQAWVVAVNDTGQYVLLKYADYPKHYTQYTQIMLINALIYRNDATVRMIYRHAFAYIKDWDTFISNAPGKLNDQVKRALIERFWAVVKQK